jgi:predicted nucleic acid-binding protein
VVAETGLDLPSFIEESQLSDVGEAFVRGALGTLHRGELETLMVARERNIDLVAIDDSAARRKAVQMSLRPIGTVGILVLARRFGHLNEATAVDKLEQLVERHGLYLSSAIIQQVRRALAEPPSDATEGQ